MFHGCNAPTRILTLDPNPYGSKAASAWLTPSPHLLWRLHFLQELCRRWNGRKHGLALGGFHRSQTQALGVGPESCLTLQLHYAQVAETLFLREMESLRKEHRIPSAG